MSNGIVFGLFVLTVFGILSIGVAPLLKGENSNWVTYTLETAGVLCILIVVVRLMLYVTGGA